MVEAEKPDSIGYFAGTGSGTPAPLLGCGFINSVSAASGEWSKATCLR